MRKLLQRLVFPPFFLLFVVVTVTALDPDTDRDAMGLITSRGFNVEAHFVETPDHYVLQLFRIPNPGSPAVFLQHGLLDSADTWLVNDRTNSLAYILADNGFDVWLGNSRGNKYSRNNTQHSPNWPFDGAFWDFSWDDMAQYDLTTQVNHALSVSKQAKLVYIGHSQGTTQAFANFANSDWSLHDKISLFVGLAPVAHVAHTGSILIKTLATFDIDKIVAFLGVHEFLPTSKLLHWLLPGVCEVTPLLCDFFVYLFAGLDVNDLDQDRMPVYVAHFPSGTSVRNMEHWAQGVRHDKFQRYDYGFIGNQFHYGSWTPPQYLLKSLTGPPMALYYGGNDDLSDPTDVQTLINSLPSNIIVNTTFIQEYAHMDFVWGLHVKDQVYNDVVRLARQYSQHS